MIRCKDCGAVIALNEFHYCGAMTDSELQAKKATPAVELERQIMSASEPKSEREWWAQAEIRWTGERRSVRR